MPIYVEGGGGGSSQPSAGPPLEGQTLWDAKGDMVVGTAADAAAKLAAGTDGQLLVPDAAAAAGLRWIDGPLGSLLIESPTYYYLPQFLTGGGTAQSAALAQTLTVWPMWVPRRTTVAAIQCNVTTLEAAAFIRLGVYAVTLADSGFTLGSLLADYGTISAATTGLKEVTGSQVVGPGWFGLAAWLSNHTIVRYARPGFANFGYGTSISNAGPVGWTLGAVDYSAGLATNPAATFTVLSNSTNRPLIGARFS
jgi:hypothetical protein